jgi:hypothetical protein
MYNIVQGIEKPPELKRKQAGSKYPLAEMQVGDSFVVPYGEMIEGDTPEKFRNRIYQSARNYALRDFNERKDAALNAEQAAKTVKKDFSAAVMTEDDKSDEKRYVTGDVVVWRDA